MTCSTYWHARFDNISTWWHIHLMTYPLDDISTWWHIHLMTYPLDDKVDKRRGVKIAGHYNVKSNVGPTGVDYRFWCRLTRRGKPRHWDYTEKGNKLGSFTTTSSWRRNLSLTPVSRYIKVQGERNLPENIIGTITYRRGELYYSLK